MRARERARVERGKKKKRKRRRTGCFLPSEQAAALLLFMWTLSATATSLLSRASASHAPVPLFFAWFYDFRCSVIPDAIGSISKVKPSFVEASARRAPPCRQEPEGLFTVWIRPGRSKLCHRDFSQPPQLVFFFFFFSLHSSPGLLQESPDWRVSFFQITGEGGGGGAVRKKGI